MSYQYKIHVKDDLSLKIILVTDQKYTKYKLLLKSIYYTKYLLHKGKYTNYEPSL